MATLKSLGYATWLNKYGWMESMKGKKWKALVKRNQDAFEIALEPLKYLQNEIYTEFTNTVSYVDPIRLYDIEIQMVGTLRYLWNYVESEKIHVCSDIDVLPDKHIWMTQDKSTGAEHYIVSHYKGEKKIWEHSKPVGPFVAVLNGRCYVLEAEKDLWYRRLISLDAKTGKDRQIIYEEKDPRWNLNLVKGENGCLFLVGNNAGQQSLGYIAGKNHLKEPEAASLYESFIPIGWPKDGKEPCFFGRRHGSSVFEPVGKALQDEKFPDFAKNIPQWFSFFEHLLCIRDHGIRKLWSSKEGKYINVVVGDFELNSIWAWRTGQTSVTVARPGYERVMYGENDICPYAHSRYFKAKSKDGTMIPYVVVSSCPSPTALLCVVYGAYGMPTHLDVSRWKPLLRRGWGLCLALVRGGGDHDDEWADAARREMKVKSVEDFEACIRAAADIFHISSRHVAIYGRSAGGYLVGATLARHPDGDLFGAVYTEVPYVDVLTTTANPDLPLTELEYDEFGDPLRRIQDAAALIKLSPVHSLSEEGAPRIFVLNRTGLQDKEVFAYESVKWITKLQDSQRGVSGAEPKLLAITDGEGHFVGGNTAYLERAADLALLIAWNKNSHVPIYTTMANTRRNRKTNTRKNNARKNNMMGGKKTSHRKGTRKAHRKGSKGRKH